MAEVSSPAASPLRPHSVPLPSFRDYMSQLAKSPIPAANIAPVVIHPRVFNGRVFTHVPMIFGLFVICITNIINSGAEKPCAIEDHTKAFIGLIPRKFSDMAMAVETRITALNRFTSWGW